MRLRLDCLQPLSSAIIETTKTERGRQMTNVPNMRKRILAAATGIVADTCFKTDSWLEMFTKIYHSEVLKSLCPDEDERYRTLQGIERQLSDTYHAFRD